MNPTDLLIDGIRDHIEAVAPTALSACSFVIRDQAADRSFPQVRVFETGVEEHEVLLGVYRASVSVQLRSIPEDDSDSSHRGMAEELWNIVADESIEESLEGVANLAVPDIRCSGPMTDVDEDMRVTTFELTAVYHES
jgi:hypothetical protein